VKNLPIIERGKENLSTKGNSDQKEDQCEREFLGVYDLVRAMRAQASTKGAGVEQRKMKQ